MSGFRYLETKVTSQNLIQEEIKRRLNSVTLDTIWSRTFCLFLLSKNVKVRIYKTDLPLASYGFETGSLILREEYKLKVFENSVVRRIFGLQRDEGMGGWRKLLKEHLHIMYISPSIIRTCICW
jgi:hypothetical protein